MVYRRYFHHHGDGVLLLLESLASRVAPFLTGTEHLKLINIEGVKRVCIKFLN